MLLLYANGLENAQCCGCNSFDEVRVIPVTDSELERDFRDWVSYLCYKLVINSEQRDEEGHRVNTFDLHCSIEYLVYLLLKQLPWERVTTGPNLLQLAEKTVRVLEKNHARFSEGGEWLMLHEQYPHNLRALIKFLQEVDKGQSQSNSHRDEVSAV
jgi:hypothetical protein